jgi:hypothetical protein
LKSVRKLQPYQVVLIRQMRREGFSRRYLAKLFRVSKNTVHQILACSTYKDVR